MALNLSSQESIRKITLDDLIEDSVERGDATALAWLEEQANTMKTRTKKDGTVYEVRKSIVEIRPEYLKRFLDYTSDAKKALEEAKRKKKEGKQREIDDKFSKAKARLQKNNKKK